jgi:hypothetical protein
MLCCCSTSYVNYCCCCCLWLCTNELHRKRQNEITKTFWKRQKTKTPKWNHQNEDNAKMKSPKYFENTKTRWNQQNLFEITKTFKRVCVKLLPVRRAKWFGFTIQFVLKIT